jgi:hypothetical protein
MCPDTERRSFGDANVPVSAASRVSQPLTIAAAAAWLLYAGIYALTFGLSGMPIGVAVRGGLANAIPDGVLAYAAFQVSRRMNLGGSSSRPPLRLHALRAVALVPAAGAAKSLLIWLDTLLHGQRFMFSPGLVTWHVFLSALIYIAVAAASHAWLIARRLREEEAHAARANALRAEAEMAALRAQLNPHFLFNTLHSVLGLVRRNPAQAEAAIEKLGDLLHYAIRVHRDGVDRTALRQELDFVQAYLDLETIRLGDRLQVVRSVDDSLLDEPVPTFSLQPLVENAVRHGIAPRAAGGRISIDVKLAQNALRIEVGNDGDGRGATGDEGGLGLRVLRDRLQALYRGGAQMAAGPTDAGGYRVVMTLPLVNVDTEARE